MSTDQGKIAAVVWAVDEYIGEGGDRGGCGGDGL